MSVDLKLLHPFGRAQGILVYGGPGTRKTHGIHTCPPPIWLADFEGGTQSVLPWIRRQRKWNSLDWIELTDVDRQEAYDMLNDANKQHIAEVTRIKPAPYIDVVFYDNMEPTSYAAYIKDIGNFDGHSYKTIALDSLKEFSEDVRTMAKGEGNELGEFVTKLWGGVQDRTGALARKLRNFRDAGVFVYLTCGEAIDKDYIRDPRNPRKAGEEAPEPISVKGNIGMFGRLVGEMQHLVDIQLHARPMGDKITWVSQPEPLATGSSVPWEAKDRTGRIKDRYLQPNVRLMLDQIYGPERRKQIYQG